jgi:hypothetical protein
LIFLITSLFFFYPAPLPIRYDSRKNFEKIFIKTCAYGPPMAPPLPFEPPSPFGVGDHAMPIGSVFD